MTQLELEKILETCPVFRSAEETGVDVEELEIYGLVSNDCKKCYGVDKSCEIFKDWYDKRGLRG